MNRYFHTLIVLFSLAVLGCSDRLAGYLSAASISANGFTRNGSQLHFASGQKIRIWGYVDHFNLFGDQGVKEILGQWWSGPGPGGDLWQFNLKANQSDAAGHSFPVIVPNDPGRDALLKSMLKNAIAGKPKKVFLAGRIMTYEAPLNLSSRVGLYLELQSSRDISFDPVHSR